jgi:hypothetical protein
MGVLRRVGTPHVKKLLLVTHIGIAGGQHGDKHQNYEQGGRHILITFNYFYVNGTDLLGLP